MDDKKMQKSLVYKHDVTWSSRSERPKGFSQHVQMIMDRKTNQVAIFYSENCNQISYIKRMHNYIQSITGTKKETVIQVM